MFTVNFKLCGFDPENAAVSFLLLLLLLKCSLKLEERGLASLARTPPAVHVWPESGTVRCKKKKLSPSNLPDETIFSEEKKFHDDLLDCMN